jgi:glycosyltransferase involved in cell wall biosynthesis
MDYAAPYEGNFIPSIENLEEHLTKSGSRLIYMFPSIAANLEWVADLRNKGKSVYFIERSFFSKKIGLKNIKFFLKVIKSEHVDIIHTHFVAYNFSLFLIKLLFARKVFIIGNFMNEYLPPRNFYSKIKIFATKSTFDLIIGSSMGVTNSVCERGINSKKVQTIYNALDTKHLERQVKISFTNDPKLRVILMFGWTYFRKGVDTAIEAVRELSKEGTHILLAIAMSGGREIIENEIIKQIGELPSWITLLGPRTDVASYYNSADIFLSSSREEGFTYSVLEAAWCSPLLIVSKISGHPMDIPDIEVFDVEHVNQLKNSIKRVLNIGSAEKEKIKRKQKEFVLKNYNVDNWSDQIIEVYKNLI